jgi:two-component system nitrate/nitrite response regulator NarL
MDFLIVEDQATMRAALGAFLRASFPACSVREAADVRSALESCIDQAPRLAVVDVQLPDGTGIELTRMLKALVPQLPVVVVSYLDSQTFADKAREAGASAYVVKDRLLPDLRVAVAQAIASSRAPR